MINKLVSLGLGILFGLGLGLSQMLNPDKILNFLDITGNWDPTLLFVFVFALLFTTISYHFILSKPKPLWDLSFHIPTMKNIDARLCIGASLFGIGWGLVGLCPAPAIGGIIFLLPESFIFMGSLLLGGFFIDIFLSKFQS